MFSENFNKKYLPSHYIIFLAYLNLFLLSYLNYYVYINKIKNFMPLVIDLNAANLNVSLGSYVDNELLLSN
jgi:hypothetical protein